MKRILFVCHGNICRSPMAEFIMKHIVQTAGLESSFYISSAATSSEEIGNPVYPPAQRELSLHGISCNRKTARQLTPSDYSSADLIVGMDSANMRNMLRLFGGDPDHKLSLLMHHANLKKDVADPWYTRDFSTTYNDILLGCTALFEQIIHS